MRHRAEPVAFRRHLWNKLLPHREEIALAHIGEHHTRVIHTITSARRTDQQKPARIRERRPEQARAVLRERLKLLYQHPTRHPPVPARTHTPHPAHLRAPRRQTANHPSATPAHRTRLLTYRHQAPPLSPPIDFPKAHTHTHRARHHTITHISRRAHSNHRLVNRDTVSKLVIPDRIRRCEIHGGCPLTADIRVHIHRTALITLLRRDREQRVAHRRDAPPEPAVRLQRARRQRALIHPSLKTLTIRMHTSRQHTTRTRIRRADCKHTI